MNDPPLAAARAALEATLTCHCAAIRQLAKVASQPDGLDEHQLVAYELALSAAECAAATESLRFAADGPAGPLEEALAVLLAAEVTRAVGARLRARAETHGLTGELLERTIDAPATRAFVEAGTSGRAYRRAFALGMERPAGPERGLDDAQRSIAATFRRFAQDVIAPRADRIHREDLLVPPEIFDGLRALGGFGLSIPAAYGGFLDADRPDGMGMVVATEELSRASLGAGGSLVTRPEILAKALLEGGTEEQKRTWLPRLAAGEAVAAVAVTEPDFGSDVAGCKVAAMRDADGGFRISGVKTWCTFAGFANVLMVLARTDSRPESRHRGLSLFLVEKPSFEGHDFVHEPPAGGRMQGRAIPTIGYRGMHSYEVVFDEYRVPPGALVGGEAGLGRGFSLQMAGFTGGRLQTAARALGVMQAAFDTALAYASERRVFGRLARDFELTQFKLARMAALLHGARQATYRAARLLDQGRGKLEASMVKLFACKVSEWVTREAMQIHGGMGYAEEFPVSRAFLDARVLSIFEGAEEVLALKVVARGLIQEVAG